MAAELQPNEPAFSFHCTLCDEDIIGIPIGLNPNYDYAVCQECAADSVVPLLLEAAESEYHYPPKWGTVPIFHSHFLHLLPPDFLRNYVKKYNEYSTPIAERIYCRAPKLKLGLFKAPEQCGRFLGRQIRTPCCKGLSTVFAGYKCPDCGDQTRASCRHCGDICSITPRLNDVDKYLHTLTFPHCSDHTCRNLTLDLATAFDGLGLGRDFQKCPNKRCGLRVELMSGCNHLVCTSVMCQTSFCAVCGKEAEHDSDHWQAGNSSCPRWNKPGAHNAQFDDPPADVQDQVVLAEGLVRAAPRVAPQIAAHEDLFEPEVPGAWID